MLPDIPLPDFGDPAAPDADWLTGAGLDDLPVPAFGDPPAFAGRPPAAPPPPPAVAPEPVLTATPPPRRALARPLLSPTAPPAAVARQFPTRVISGPDATAVIWQLTVSPTEPWDDVRVRFAIPKGLPAAHITNKPSVTRRQVTWSLGAVDAGRTVALQIRFAGRGAPPSVAAAPPPFEVSYTPRPAARLVVRAVAPDRVRPGRPVELRVEVSNVGTAATAAVRVTAFAGGCSAGAAAVPPVPVGSTVTVAVPVPAPDAGGVARWEVRASADGSESAIATAQASVCRPLEVALAAPARVELDAEHTFAVRVENPNDRPLDGGRVTLRVPIELRVGASDGRVNRATAEVTWDVAGWGPGEVREFAATATGCLPGRFAVEAEIDTEDGPRTVSAAGECVLVGGRDSAALAEWLRQQAVTDADEGRAAPAETRTGERHVVFRLGGQTYASPIRQLREVVRLPAVTPVPGTPDWLLGVANVRGDVLSVVDFPVALGVPAEPSARRSLLVTAAPAVGLTVDEVLGIRRCAPTPWAAEDRREAGTVGEYLTGLFEYDHRLTPVLDLEQVLSSGLLATGAA